MGYNLSHTFTSLSKRGTMDVGLGGNAPHVQTCTTNIVGLEDNYLQSLFGGIFSGAVTARSRTDDEKVGRRTADHSTIVHLAIVYRW